MLRLESDFVKIASMEYVFNVKIASVEYDFYIKIAS